VVMTVAVPMSVAVLMAVVVAMVVVVGVSHHASSRMAESGRIIAFPDDLQMLSRWLLR
jgi:hypothetical protein